MLAAPGPLLLTPGACDGFRLNGAHSADADSPVPVCRSPIPRHVDHPGGGLRGLACSWNRARLFRDADAHGPGQQGLHRDRVGSTKFDESPNSSCSCCGDRTRAARRVGLKSIRNSHRVPPERYARRERPLFATTSIPRMSAKKTDRTADLATPLSRASSKSSPRLFGDGVHWVRIARQKCYGSVVHLQSSPLIHEWPGGEAT